MRLTRRQYVEKLPQPKRKIGFNEAMARLKREVKRKMIADGVIPATRPPRFTWTWAYESQTGSVEADSRSDARGLIKQQLGIPSKERLPINITITRSEGSKAS